MTSYDNLANLLNWKLLSGSHGFPGPDGGTCINEAAIVAAGMQYREVKSVNDCPPCFSRPIAAYALRLNDAMPGSVRQRLIPFVMRLSGSADSDEIELARNHYIAIETVRRIVAPLMRLAELEDQALACAEVTENSFFKVTAKAAKAANAAYAADAAYAAYAADAAKAAYAANAAYAAYAANAADAADAAKAADAADAAKAAYAANAMWDEAIAILDGALRIGKQAEPIATDIVAERMDAVRNRRTVHA